MSLRMDRMTRKISFDLFLSVWNVAQNLDTPPVHLKMGRWLARQMRSRKKRLLLMAFRGAGKSTLTGLFCAWLLLNDPELRILILSADEELAEQMLRHVRHILEMHPLTKTLRPIKKTLWSSDRLQVQRQTVSRDPSVRAAGLHSNITGARADLIVCDDVEVPKTCETHGKREALRSRLSELDFILTPHGMILYIGTPHTEESLYAADGFLQTYERLQIPLDAAAWPTRFTPATIETLRQSAGPRVFASQMLLQSVSMHERRLDPAKIVFYADDVLPYPSRCVWDPAFGRASGDASVIVLAHQDGAGVLYMHDIAYLPQTDGDDAAQIQCAAVIDFLRRHNLRHLILEANGLGQFLPGLLRRALKDADYACAVQPLHQSKAKNTRILEAFEARLAAGSIHAHERVKATSLIREMRDFDPNRANNDDDGLDAVATAAHALPRGVTMTRQFFISEETHD